MEQNAYVMEAIAGIICLVLGARLYWLSRRSVKLSDSFIGLALLTWALGYALYDIPYAFTQSDELIPPFFSYTSMLVFNLGNVVLAMFTQEVFRKHEHWAGWLVVALAVCMLLLFRTFTPSGERVRVPLGAPPFYAARAATCPATGSLSGTGRVQTVS
jgi:FtsH-binding integral membrane protein